MVHVMEKLDSMTPAHSVRTYQTVQEAMFAAHKWAKERKQGEKFPQYTVNGRVV